MIGSDRGGSMIVDLKRIFVEENASLPITYAFDMHDVEFAGAFPLSKPVTFDGVVSNKADLVELKAVIMYTVTAPCDRCGVMTEHLCTVKVDKVLAVSVQSEENDHILLTPDRMLDLDEFIYSEVVVSFPSKHLCREDCRGLCPQCGRNLNEGDCDCPKTEIDPRLSALAELLTGE